MTSEPACTPAPHPSVFPESTVPLTGDLGQLPDVFAAMPSACLLLTPELHIAAVSDAYLAATFSTREQLIGRYLFNAFPENPAAPEAQAVSATIQASLRQVLATGQPHYMPVQHYDVADPATPGTFLERYWEPVNTPVLNAQGLVIGVIHQAVDVTERVQAEARLRESQARERLAAAEAEAQRQRLLNLFAQAPALVAIFRGPDHVFDLTNERYRAAFGSRQLQGLPFREAAPELAEQGFLALLDEVYRTGETYSATESLVYLKQDGQLQPSYYNFIYQATYDAAGRRDGILNFAYEVTDQVLARQRVQTLNEELAASNEELRTTNEEHQQANNALQEVQLLLRQLNADLEGQVQQRTRQVEAAARQLAEEREGFLQILEQTPASICILRGPEHRIAYHNPAYVRVHGGLDHVGRTLEEGFPNAEPQAYIDLLDSVYRTGQTRHGYEMPYGVQDVVNGPLRPAYYDFTFFAYREGGQVVGVGTFAYDVTQQVLARQRTERLQAELLAASQRQVQEREDLYQIFAQTPAAVVLLRGPEHRLEYINAAGEQLFAGHYLRGGTVLEAMPEAETQGFVTLLNHVYHTGETYLGNEVPLTLPDETGQLLTTYFNFSYQAYREQGQVVGIGVFAYDVTEQVRARQQREAQQRQLTEVFTQAPVAICVFQGPDYVLDLVNPPMSQMMGHPLDCLAGRPLLTALPELADQDVRELLDEVRRTGTPYVAHERAIRLGRHAAGEVGYFNFVFQPLRDELTQIKAIICVAIEVTEQVEARRAVQELNEELHESNSRLRHINADLDNFVYTASHDLKSPISNIEGLLLLLPELLPEAVRMDAQVGPMLSLMRDSVERFKRTIAHLTEVSKLQAEFAQPAASVSLAAVVEDVRQDLLPQLGQTLAQLEVAVGACRPRVFSEKNLRSLLYNLLSNALKYQHSDRPPRVRIACEQQGNHFVLTVQDNGLGLSQQQQARLFQLFQRLHTHVEGTGVGLYMVKKIIDNAGGSIQVQSRPGIGTTFTLVFPA